jgi:outer membrane protein assembly factor BamD
MKQIMIFIFIVFSFTACFDKNKELEYNKPAVYWYNKMLKQISKNNIDDADDTYTSLESEHKQSPLLPSALMIIATAHMDAEEYEMANYYFDEYLEKFGRENNIDYVRYLKVKSKFMGFKNQYREQQLVLKAIIEAKNYIRNYPYSKYVFLVRTMKSRLEMAKASFDYEIAKMYDRTDKPKSAKIYYARAKHVWHDLKHVNSVKVPWYRAVFE